MEILERILADRANRVRHICEFQQSVWNDENASELLSELALDLDYYEPNEELRKEDPSYYGDERLEQEIRSVIRKIQMQSLT